MKKCKNCEVNNFGWCMYYDESVDKITKCEKDVKWRWVTEPEEFEELNSSNRSKDIKRKVK